MDDQSRFPKLSDTGMLCVETRGLGSTARDLIPALPPTKVHVLGQGGLPRWPSVSVCEMGVILVAVS